MFNIYLIVYLHALIANIKLAIYEQYIYKLNAMLKIHLEKCKKITVSTSKFGYFIKKNQSQ